jgi:hypothetical protein
MTCEFALKKDGEILCRCINLAHGRISGYPTNVQSPKCLENQNCYYKLWRREQKKNGE